jgi:hypothetical protein
MTLICWIFSKETKNPAVELIIFFLKKVRSYFSRQKHFARIVLHYTHQHYQVIRILNFRQIGKVHWTLRYLIPTAGFET